MLLHQILKTTLFQEFRLILFQVADNLGSTFHLTMHHFSVLLHSERTSSSGLPDVLLIIIVLADNSYLVTDKVGTVEANTELTNHGDITSSSHGLHESLRATLGNCSEIVDKFIL